MCYHLTIIIIPIILYENELTIEGDKSQELLELLYGRKELAFLHHTHLGRIWHKLSLLHHESQESDR